MKIILSDSKGKHAINLTKYDWMKTSKKLGIVFQYPSKIVIGSQTYTEGQEINLNDKQFLVAKVEKIENKSIELLDTEDNIIKITIDENNWPIEDYGKYLFNIHPSKSPSRSKNEIRRLLNGSITHFSQKEWKHNGYKISLEIDKEEDNVKKIFYVTNPDGQEMQVPLSPYSSDKTVNLWIDAGCPQFPPPKGSNWNKEQLEEYIKTNKMWYNDTFGNVHPTPETKKLALIIKNRFRIIESAKITAATGPVPEGMAPNVFCSWCKKAIGYNPKIPENSNSHGICNDCIKKINEKEEMNIDIGVDEDNLHIAQKEHIVQKAQNQVNMGAEVNNGMQAAPDTPTMEQEEQMKADFAADLDVTKGYTGSQLQNFKKSLTPEMKNKLLSSLTRLTGSFPQIRDLAKNPRLKQDIMMFLEQMSHSDIGKMNNLRNIIQGLQNVSDQEVQMALAPESVPQQQVQRVQNMNPQALR